MNPGQLVDYAVVSHPVPCKRIPRARSIDSNHLHHIGGDFWATLEEVKTQIWTGRNQRPSRFQEISHQARS